MRANCIQNIIKSLRFKKRYLKKQKNKLYEIIVQKISKNQYGI